MGKILGCGVAAVVMLAASQASALTVTRTYTFDFTDFEPFIHPSGLPAPVDPVTGVFTLTFDPNVAATDQTVGLVVDSFNLSVAGHIGFTYTPGGELEFGGITDPSDIVNSFPLGVDDFFLGFSDVLTDPTTPFASYTRAGVGEAWTTNSATVTAHDGPAGVPEPAGWALMMLGFGLAGAAIRGRNRAIDPAQPGFARP